MSLPPLWHENENDPDWIMVERLRDELLTSGGGTHLDTSTRVFGSLVRVYYDVFNNGGSGLLDGPAYIIALKTLLDYAEEKSIECPEFICENGRGGYDVLCKEDMDAFARQIIRHLYLDET